MGADDASRGLEDLVAAFRRRSRSAARWDIPMSELLCCLAQSSPAASELIGPLGSRGDGLPFRFQVLLTALLDFADADGRALDCAAVFMRCIEQMPSRSRAAIAVLLFTYSRQILDEAST